MLPLRDNPPMTLPGAGPVADEPAPWRVAYTKPRQEKALAWDLARKEIPYFLPLVLRETSSGGRRRRNLYPLFASYLFYAGDEETRLAALKTERIVSHVEIAPGEQDRFRREIAALELGLRAAPDQFELHPRLVPGARVRVIGGPMKGLEGTVVSADRPTRLLVGVTALGAGASVEIHPDLVEPVAGAPDWQPGTIEYQVAAGRFVATAPSANLGKG
ncbi:MAG: KOW motif-containing protein [Pirellulales bacterium]|nr:KOW motif-containing protein [Pirellulales bacterium]